MPRDKSAPVPLFCPHCGITAARCIPSCLWAEPPGTVIWGRDGTHTVVCGGCGKGFEYRTGESQ